MQSISRGIQHRKRALQMRVLDKAARILQRRARRWYDHRMVAARMLQRKARRWKYMRNEHARAIQCGWRRRVAHRHVMYHRRRRPALCFCASVRGLKKGAEFCHSGFAHHTVGSATFRDPR